MPLQIEIPDEDARYLSQQAQEELVASTKKYSQELLNEANRLEAANRENGGDPEITRVMIRDAALHVQRYPPRSKRSWGFTVIQIASAITALLTGGLFDVDKMQQDIGRLIIFLILLSLTIIFATTEIILGRTQ